MRFSYRGPVYLSFDVGEAGSGTAACAYWPVSGAMRTWLAFGGTPSLKARGKRDNADYAAMERRGELRTYAGPNGSGSGVCLGRARCTGRRDGPGHASRTNTRARP